MVVVGISSSSSLLLLLLSLSLTLVKLLRSCKIFLYLKKKRYKYFSGCQLSPISVLSISTSFLFVFPRLYYFSQFPSVSQFLFSSPRRISSVSKSAFWNVGVGTNIFMGYNRLSVLHRHCSQVTAPLGENPLTSPEMRWNVETPSHKTTRRNIISY